MIKLGTGLKIGSGIKIGHSVSDNDMILVYEIPDPSTDIELAIQANSTWFSAGQGVAINWGDGSAAETVSATSEHTGYIGHTYASAGTYTIKISGSMTRYGRSNNVNIAGQTLLTRVDSFGNLGITSFLNAFYGCDGLISVPKALPSKVTSMSHMFRFCRGDRFNPDVSNWDVSGVENMNFMFGYCSGAAFNPDVSNWDVSKVKDMSYMFCDCPGASFNPDVSNWNVSKVTNMVTMFRFCRGDRFNPDVSNWDVSNVTSMNNMFYGCRGAAFNPNMESWTLKTGVTIVTMLTASRIQPTTWLDELLIAWAANSAQGNNIIIDFSPNKFTEVEGEPLPAVDDALTALNAKGWSITTANPYPAP